MPNTGSTTAPATPQKPLSIPTPTARSGELLGAGGTLHIEHKGAIYTLRATSKGGLILTK